MRNAHTFRKWSILLAFSTLVSVSSGSAITHVPGTNSYYIASVDPITDVNTGAVIVGELYDQNAETVLFIRCASRGVSGVWADLMTKNTLLTQDSEEVIAWPDVILRFGSDAPITVTSASLTSVTNQADELKTTDVAFSTTFTKTMITGLVANKKLVIRVTRAAGGAPLTYTFPAAGFATAWKAVNQCR